MDEFLEPRRNLTHALGGLVLAAVLVTAGRVCGDNTPPMPTPHAHAGIAAPVFMPGLSGQGSKAGFHVRVQ